MATTPTRSDDELRDAAARVDREFAWIAWAILGLIVLGAAALVLAWSSPNGADQEARDLASQFAASLGEQGLQVPDEETIARTFGTDGGAACTLSASELARAVATANLQRTGEINGRSGLVDPRAVAWERTMIATYCPERTDEFDDFVDGLRIERTRAAAG
jgi:hypothetical protein